MKKFNFFFENLYKGSSNMHEISLRTEKIYENAIGSSGSSTTMKLPALSLSARQDATHHLLSAPLTVTLPV